MSGMVGIRPSIVNREVAMNKRRYAVNT